MGSTAPLFQPLYIEAAPRQSLRGIVRRVWRFEGPGDGAKIERIPPDGCAELIVHIACPYEEIDEYGRAHSQPLILFAGQLTKPLAIAARASVATVGVRFEPDGARAFAGAPMQQTTDKRIDLVSLHGAEATELQRSVAQAAGPVAAFDLVQDYVERRAFRVAGDPVVRAAVTALERGEGGGFLGGLPERQLQRRFLDRVGVSARTLQSIFRFRRVFNSIEKPEDPDWVSAALAAGYFDQPQMARDFRRFLGCTASEWARQKVGLAALLASESYKP